MRAQGVGVEPHVAGLQTAGGERAGHERLPRLLASELGRRLHELDRAVLHPRRLGGHGGGDVGGAGAHATLPSRICSVLRSE